MMTSITCLLRADQNPFDDPALIFFLVQQLICNRLMDKLVKFMCFSLLWKPKDNAVFRVFNKNVAISLRRKDAKVAQEKYRRWFLERHTGWLVSKMNDIFTPRSRDRYRAKLSQLYQDVLMLQPPTMYKVPGPAFPPPVARDE